MIPAMEVGRQFARFRVRFQTRFRTAGHHAIKSGFVLGTIKARRFAPPARS
jgi:hypothetical protein